MITVHKEPDGLGAPHECCCLCGRPTAWWYFPNAENTTGFDAEEPPGGSNEVACCQTCAIGATREEMPSKQEWCEREGRKAKKAAGALQ